MNGVRRVLYGLPNVRAGIDAGESVYLVEGEKDCHTLAAAWDAVVTTSPGGAKAWRREYAAMLEGATLVTVIADRDPAGYAYALAVAESLREAGIPGALALSKPDLARSDPSDHVNAGFGRLDLVSVAEEDLSRMISAKGEEEPCRRERFRLVTARELAEPVPAMRWLIEGVWPLGSYGPLAGEKKTLKTWHLLALAVAVAAGVPAFGEFTVPEALPVVLFLGEGGQAPTQRRLQRIAEAYGVRLDGLPLGVVFDAGPVDGPEFRGALAGHVESMGASLVGIDPLYAYHPPGVEAQNLYERGRMLADLTHEMPDGVSLIVNDHFRKTGSTDLDLDSIAQSGMGAWADSWILMAHREPADVPTGRFRLAVEYGSRQWGGRRYESSWDMGVFDPDTGEHDGKLGWAFKPMNYTESHRGAAGTGRLQDTICEVLRDHPFELTKTEVIKNVGGNAQRVRDAFGILIDQNLIEMRKIAAPEGPNGVPKTRDRWGMNEHPTIRVSQLRPKPTDAAGRG